MKLGGKYLRYLGKIEIYLENQLNVVIVITQIFQIGSVKFILDISLKPCVLKEFFNAFIGIQIWFLNLVIEGFTEYCGSKKFSFDFIRLQILNFMIFFRYSKFFFKLLPYFPKFFSKYFRGGKIQLIMIMLQNLFIFKFFEIKILL